MSVDEADAIALKEAVKPDLTVAVTGVEVHAYLVNTRLKLGAESGDGDDVLVDHQVYIAERPEELEGTYQGILGMDIITTARAQAARASSLETRLESRTSMDLKDRI